MTAVQFTADVVRYIPITVPASEGGFYSVYFPVDNPASPNWGGGLWLYADDMYRASFPSVNEFWIHLVTDSVSLIPNIFIGGTNTATGFGIDADNWTERLDYYLQILFNGATEDVTYDYASGLEDTGGADITLHFKSGTTDGLLEVSVRDTVYRPEYGYSAAELEEWQGSRDCIQTFTRTGNVNNGQPFTNVFIALPEPDWIDWEARFDAHLGNIVLSDKEIDINGDLVLALFPIDAAFDVQRNVIWSVELVCDVHAEIIRSVSFPCDLLRQIPHEVVLSPTENNVFIGRAETQGVQSIEIVIAPQQLTDRVTFTATGDFDIMQYIHGQYLDYKYSIRIEELSKQGVLTTCSCCSDIDKILYTQLSYHLRKNRRVSGIFLLDTVALENQMKSKIRLLDKAKGPAIAHLEAIADALDKKLSVNISNFTTTVDVNQEDEQRF